MNQYTEEAHYYCKECGNLCSEADIVDPSAKVWCKICKQCERSESNKEGEQ